jgi:CheY-like chemotaxis protein
MNAESTSQQQPPGAPVAILFVDDDPNDMLLVQRALKKAGLSCPLIHRRDGEEAIDYLSGFDVLSWMQRQPSLAKIPVVILTASVRQEDQSQAQKLGAAGYRAKPVEFAELVDIIRDVDARWLSQIKHVKSVETLNHYNG